MAHHVPDPASPRAGRGPATTSSTACPSCSRRTSRASASCRRRPAGSWPTPSPNCAAASGARASSACNLNPDPSGGYWTAPPMTDPYWYPLYEAMVELDVPGDDPRRHRRATRTSTPSARTTSTPTRRCSCSSSRATCSREFPTLRLVIPHGGGAVPYHWGRLPRAGRPARPAAAGRAPDGQRLLRHLRLPPGGRRPAARRVIDVDNVLFASEMIGAVRGIDPRDRLPLGRHQALRRALRT